VCEDPRMRSKGNLPAEHKFRAGERVRLAASAPKWGAAEGGYVVTKRLPERGGEFEYRIKSISEPHERVARESELARE
jgi:hypothetical protein